MLLSTTTVRTSAAALLACLAVVHHAGAQTGGTLSPTTTIDLGAVFGKQNNTAGSAASGFSKPGAAGQAASPGMASYSLDPEQQRKLMAASELSGAQDRATVLTELPKTIVLYVGQMVLIKGSGVARVAVGSGKIVNARMVEGEGLLVTALDAGDSTLHVWSKSGTLRKVKVRVNIVDNERTIEELRDMTLGIPGVTIRRVGEKVVMDGSNLDPGAVTRLGMLAKLYPHVVNLASADRIRVDRMVDIQVRIMEFNKSALDDLGVKWQNGVPGFNFGVFSDIAANKFRVLPEGSVYQDARFLENPGRQHGGYFGLAATLGSTLQLMVERGNAFLLASPNLSTRSGGEAKFLAGGEIPLPAISAIGGGSVDFKPYGVLLNIKPIADSAGNIAGNILTEVSSIDRSVAVQGIPGLLIRRTDTEFNVKDGETIVLSGLISRESSRGSQGLPGLRNIPVLGQAFRANNDSDRETEVVVFITPRVVDANYGRPRVERVEQLERDTATGFGNLTEDLTAKPAKQPAAPMTNTNGRLNAQDGP